MIKTIFTEKIELQKRINALEEQVKSFEAEKQTIINEFNAKIEAKDKEIVDIKNQMEEFSKSSVSMESVNQMIANKDVEIENLKSELGNLDSLAAQKAKEMIGNVGVEPIKVGKTSENVMKSKYGAVHTVMVDLHRK